LNRKLLQFYYLQNAKVKILIFFDFLLFFFKDIEAACVEIFQTDPQSIALQITLVNYFNLKSIDTFELVIFF
jgi:hypothetical protein